MSILIRGPIPCSVNWTLGTHPPPDARVIVGKMCELLAKRRYGRIGRRSFLVRWGSLRKDLAHTTQYKALRVYVIKRSGGRCERRCGRDGSAMHHLTPVSMNPLLALDKKNVAWICRPCHVSSHPHLQEREDGNQEEGS